LRDHGPKSQYRKESFSEVNNDRQGALARIIHEELAGADQAVEIV
jgi:hypothetical protein